MAEQAFDLRKVVRIVRRNKLLVGAFAAMGLLGGAGFAVVSPPTFMSTAQVVLPGAVQSAAAALSGAPGTGNGTGTGDYMSTQVLVAGSDPVLSLALRDVTTATSIQALRRDIHISTPTIGIVSVTAKGRSAAQAENTANAVANSYVRYVGSAHSLVGRTSAHIINPATHASGTSPVRRAVFDALVSGICGALVGIIVALVVSRGSRRLRERDEIANSLGLPVVASLPVDHPADAAGWTRLLDEYQPAAIHAWQLRTALRELGMLRSNVRSRGNGVDPSLTVLSLASDHGACALGPQLAVFAASLGIPTVLVVGARQDTAALATLRTACAAPRSASSARPHQLHVVESDGGDDHGRPDGALTVVVAVIDDDASKFPHLMRTAMTVLGVSAGVTTADQLARVAVTAAADGRDIAGIIVADPEPTDRTTGHAPQLIKVSKPQTARSPERAGSHARPGYETQAVSEPARQSHSLTEQGSRLPEQAGRPLRPAPRDWQ